MKVYLSVLLFVTFVFFDTPLVVEINKERKKKSFSAVYKDGYLMKAAKQYALSGMVDSCVASSDVVYFAVESKSKAVELAVLYNYPKIGYCVYEEWYFVILGYSECFIE